MKTWEQLHMEKHRLNAWRSSLTFFAVSSVLALGLIVFAPGVVEELVDWERDGNVVIGACGFILAGMVVSFANVMVLSKEPARQGFWFQSTNRTVKSLNEAQQRLIGVKGHYMAASDSKKLETPVQKRAETKTTQNSGSSFRVSYSSPGESVLYSGDRGFGTTRRRMGRQTGSTPSSATNYGSPNMIPGRMTSPAAGSFGDARSPFAPRDLTNRFSQMRSPQPTNYASPSGLENKTCCPNCHTPIENTTGAVTKYTSPGPSYQYPNSDMDEDAYTLLQNLQVDWNRSGGSSSLITVSSCIDDWTDNLTRTLCKHVREHIISAYERNTESLVELPGNFFQKQVLEHDLKDSGSQPSPLLESARQRATQEYEAVLRQRPQQSGGIFASSMNQNQQASQQQVEAQQALSRMTRLLEERARIMKSLQLSTVQGRFSKDLVLQRLKSLFGTSEKAIRYRLNNYAWDSPTPPTDPDILVHVACDWLDRSLRIDERQDFFASLHVRDISVSNASFLLRNEGQQSKDIPDNFWGLLRSTITPDGRIYLPHYNVVVQGQLWNVKSGRYNALHAILLLIYSMRVRRAAGIEAIEHVIGGSNYS